MDKFVAPSKHLEEPSSKARNQVFCQLSDLADMSDLLAC